MKHVIVILSLLSLFACNAQKEKKDMTKILTDFIKNHVDTVSNLLKESNIAYWNASISGKEEDYKKNADLMIKVSKIYTNKKDFALLKEIKAADSTIKDPLLHRQLEVLYDQYLEHQADEKKLEKIIHLENEIEKKFSTFRTTVDGKPLSDNEVDKLLTESISSEEAKKVYLASKQVGKFVADDVLKVVRLRNEVAKELGFKNYHHMSLTLSEQNPDEIEALFNELDDLTRASFVELKGQIDDFVAQSFKVNKNDLMPWHFKNRFFQEAPKIYKADLDKYYEKQDLVVLTENYFAGIGLPIEDMVKKSDLLEKKGKNQHAFCTDIDKEGDVRVLCNLKSNEYWAGTMLHEYGHAVYDKFMDKKIPYLLREPAHIFTTEAIAMLFGRFSKNPQWLQDMIHISDADKATITNDCSNTLKLEQLTFSRWVQVMYRFEKSMYENPDQDLNKKWWDLVEKYQLLKRPENQANAADWASKIHIATAPCYYHNYLMGELLASQLYFHISDKIVHAQNQSFVNRKEVGTYLKEKVFAQGAILPWNDMILNATGEKLTAKYYAKQFVNR